MHPGKEMVLSLETMVCSIFGTVTDIKQISTKDKLPMKKYMGL